MYYCLFWLFLNDKVNGWEGGGRSKIGGNDNDENEEEEEKEEKEEGKKRSSF